jgi:hypothetical protein
MQEATDRTTLKIEAAWAFRRGGFLYSEPRTPLFALARRAVAASRFAGTGPAALAARGIHVGLAVLRLVFVIRLHSH